MVEYTAKEMAASHFGAPTAKFIFYSWKKEGKKFAEDIIKRII
jgi:hypothetical protein